MCAPSGVSVKVVFGLVTLVAMVACEPPSSIEAAQLLEAHLSIRENVHPSASNMRLMRYSKDLEALADSWAKLCSFRPPTAPAYRGVMQSTVVISGKKPPITEGVCAWKREAKHYTYSNNSCTGVCSHYTQMVWATTNKVGCAMQQCDGLIPGLQNPQYLIVCDYKPGGKQRGQRPYEEGPSCSKCPAGQTCFRNQCVEKSKRHPVKPMMGTKNHEDVTVPACVIYKD